ncbi:MAG: GDP-mannose 4,6-dehydratase [Halioglobus sp.]|nr:GDP-mannose 4,6-dehydratase [Halioglobus sp.]
MTRVLITGIGSFTGPYIARELGRAGFEVFGLSQNPETSEHARVLVGSILDPATLEEAIKVSRPQVVIHLAAVTYVPHGDVGEIYQTNVVGTRNLLDALSRQEVIPEKVLLASSANVYGNTEAAALDESAAFSPENDYAVSKVAMEYMARTWSDRLPISIVRPFNYTGVGQASKFLIPKIVSHFKQQKAVIELGNTDVTRDFSDVRFVGSAYRELVEKAEPGEAYNICSGEGHSLHQIIETMNDIAGYKISVTVNPAFVRENEVKKLVGSNSKLLGLCPSLERMPIRDTLEWMYSDDTM